MERHQMKSERTNKDETIKKKRKKTQQKIATIITRTADDLIQHL